MTRKVLKIVFVLAVATALASSQVAHQAARGVDKDVPSSTAQSETKTNAAGSVSGNSGTVGAPAGETQQNSDSAPAGAAAGTTPARGGVTGAESPTGADPSTIQQQSVEQPATAGANAAGNGFASGVATPTDPSTLRDQIQSAYKSDATLASTDIRVSVSNSEIVLTGNVATIRQKTTARRIAQSYGSNHRVIDKITVAGSSANASTQESSGVAEEGAKSPQSGTQNPQSDTNAVTDRSPSPR